VASYEEWRASRQLQFEELPVPVNLVCSPQLSSSLKSHIAVNNNSPEFFAVHVVTFGGIDMLIIWIE